MISKLCCQEKRVDSLLIGEEGKRHCVLIKDCNTFMYDDTFLLAKHFCCYCFQAFRTEEILKSHIKDCFKIKGKQRAIRPKKVNMLSLKIMKAK